jgi:RHS repeat-associated protein
MLLSSTGTSVGPFGFAGGYGYQEHPDSGLKLLGCRYYDPSTGRFLTRNPDYDGRNWYAYCANNPLASVNQDGACAVLVLLAWIDPEPATKAILIGIVVATSVYAATRAVEIVQAQRDVDTPRFRCKPGDIDRGYRTSRRFGPDGYPQTDRDWNRDGDHSHDWDRNSDGSPPTKDNRGPQRQPTPDDPPIPRNNPDYPGNDPSNSMGGVVRRGGVIIYQ